MPFAGEVHVRGLRELNAAFKKMDADLGRELRQELIRVGEPIRVDAEQLAVSEISGLADGDRWSQMRLGSTARAVYVAPRARRRRGTPRSTFGALLMSRAMQPALERNSEIVVLALDGMLDRLGREAGF